MASLALIIVPRVLGWVPLTVLSGSMEPAISAGSQVVVEPVEGDDIGDVQIGDVVTFMPYPEDPTLVTHRVIGQSVSSDGETALTTQGDANNSPDEEEVTATQLRGVVRYHVPYAGYAANALSGEQKRLGLTVVGVLLIGYSVIQLTRAFRRRRDEHASAGASSDADIVGSPADALAESSSSGR